MSTSAAPGPENLSPALVQAPTELWRVSSLQYGLDFSRIQPLDAPLKAAGNRFDVPGGGVLYCCTDVKGCFAETLSRLRPSPALIELAMRDASGPGGFMPPASIPADWRRKRRRFKVTTLDALPFVDVEHEETRAYLTSVLAPDLARHDVTELDVPTVRGGNRLLTRDIARWFYEATDEGGVPLYSGIRYVSRHGDYECWAVFEGTPVEELERQSIEPQDLDMAHVARIFGLTVH